MAKIKKNELKGMGIEELKKRLIELKNELLALRGQVSTGAPLQSPGMVKANRKNIARIITYLKQKEVTKKINE